MNDKPGCGCGSGESERIDIKPELLRRIRRLKPSGNVAPPERPDAESAPTVMTDLRIHVPGGETINPV
ncbi:MAG: hypothetical protein IT464_16225 [Planctomycetes bacterium]|nr:hypothetical protein [Planctomycetota bacterium]